MKKIMLLISHKMNRKLLKEYLSEMYDVILPEGSMLFHYEADLIIADHKNYNIYQTELNKLKQQKEPLFLPVLLLLSYPSPNIEPLHDNSLSRVTNITFKNIDDTIRIPVTKPELERKINNFLRITQLSRALDERENFLARLTENNPAGICVLQNERIVYCNLAFSEIFNKSSNELYNFTFLDIITHLPKIKKIVKNPEIIDIDSKQEPIDVNLKINNKNKWCEIRFSTITYNQTLSLLVIVTDITERKEREREICYLSFHDSLTGLYNRAYMEKEMKRLDVKRQMPISVIMADLNGLKLVNDTYGHNTGDEMLKKTAEVLRNSLRSEDIIARWGGDEFVILLPQTTIEETEIICSRINFKSETAYIENIPISMALGTKVKNSEKEEMTDILKDAEDEMYRNKLTQSSSIKSTLINMLLKTLEEKSFETETHVHRMRSLGLKIGKKIRLLESELNRLELIIMLHDIGKVDISEEILMKKGPLTDKEWQIIKKHPEIGSRIARATEEFAHAAEDILCHHERWDGKGYPQGLKGTEIPLLARIVAIADAYEVMANGRPYKEPLSKEEIIAEFKRCAGTQFDPGLVEIVLGFLEEEDVL